MNEQPTVFSYTYSRKKLIALAAGSAGLSISLGCLAMTNDRGLVIQRAIRLTSSGATNLYWSVSLLGLAFLLFFLSILLTRKHFPRQVVLESKYLLAPTSRWPFSMYEEVVRYNAIQHIQATSVYRMTTLRILHKNGKTELDAVRFESGGHFLAFCQELGHRVAAARAEVK